MKITIAAVGRARAGLFSDLYRHYADRLTPRPTLLEVEVPGRAGAGRKREEGRKLLAAIPAGARIICLEESGKGFSSAELSGWIRRARDDAIPGLCFVIGGADGLAAEVVGRADLTLSLGRMTWPHLLVRGMLAEQLYRAQQIRAGHPYHRD